MSVVTDVMVIWIYWTDERIMEKLQAFPYDGIRKLNLPRIDFGNAGGTKVWAPQIYAGAFNHLPVADFLAYLDGIEWGEMKPQILIKGKDDDIFKMVHQ
jgi:hypothetical protein